jgi:DNA-binding FrmR family transcriptional regulator
MSKTMSEADLSQQAMTRLRRIEGQVRGIQRMLAEPGEASCDPCDNVLTQVLAVRAAVEQVGLLLLQLHLERCVLEGVPVDEERMRSLAESLRLWSRLS